MATTAEIKNLALFELGFTEDVDFDETTDKTVVAVNKVYDTVKNTALSRYVWAFARKVAQSDSPSDLTDEKYKYSHALPDDFLYLRNIYSNENLSSIIRDYVVKATDTDAGIETNVEDIYILYTYEVADANLPEYFVDYLRYALAFNLCFNLTGNADLENKLAMMADRYFLKSKSIDSRQNKVHRIKSSPFIDVRR
jgi:hypothetical protein